MLQRGWCQTVHSKTTVVVTSPCNTTALNENFTFRKFYAFHQAGLVGSGRGRLRPAWLQRVSAMCEDDTDRNVTESSQGASLFIP